MKEINEKDLEKASGGVTLETEGYTRHEKTFTCRFFDNHALSELKKNHNIDDLELNCFVCANAKWVGDGTEDVYCVKGH